MKLKRLFDLVVAFGALVALSPVMLALAMMIRMQLGSPVLFRQLRPGLNGKPFEMFKFRTMREAVDADGKSLPDSERLTDFGRFLRAASLDELPELWNVFKGDMSLVGPRPLLMEYLEYYTEEELLRHKVRPGVTGLAQINGRNTITWEDKLRLDVDYVKTRNFWFDIKIIAKTILKVIKKVDVLERAPQGSLIEYRSGFRGDKNGEY